MNRGSHSLLPILLVMLLAAGLRGVVLWKYGPLLEEDRDQYRAIAENLVAGRGFSDPRTGLPTAYRPPVYPLVLSTLLAFGGGSLSIGVLQLLLGTATVGMTCAAGRLLGWRHRATLAALLVACDPLLLHNTALVMTETTAAYLATLLLLLLLGTPSGNEPARYEGPIAVFCQWRPFLVGTVLGLCCLCRPTFWAWGLMLAIFWIVDRLLDPAPGAAAEDVPQPLEGIFHPSVMRPESIRSEQAAGRSRRQPRTPRGVIWKSLLGLLCIILPWVGRNARSMGWPIVTTTHGGYTLLLAHNPTYHVQLAERPFAPVWDGESLRKWQAQVEDDLSRENPPLDITRLSPEVEIGRDEWMSDTAWRILLNDPVMTFRSGISLLTRLWNIVPQGQQADALSPLARWGMGVFYGVVFLLMLAGFFTTLRDWPLWAPPALLIGSVTVVHMLYWADMRMRAPLVPAIALFAVAGLGRLPFARALLRQAPTTADYEAGGAEDAAHELIPPL